MKSLKRLFTAILPKSWIGEGDEIEGLQQAHDSDDHAATNYFDDPSGQIIRINSHDLDAQTQQNIENRKLKKIRRRTKQAQFLKNGQAKPNFLQNLGNNSMEASQFQADSSSKMKVENICDSSKELLSSYGSQDDKLNQEADDMVNQKSREEEFNESELAQLNKQQKNHLKRQKLDHSSSCPNRNRVVQHSSRVRQILSGRNAQNGPVDDETQEQIIERPSEVHQGGESTNFISQLLDEFETSKLNNQQNELSFGNQEQVNPQQNELDITKIIVQEPSDGQIPPSCETDLDRKIKTMKLDLQKHQKAALNSFKKIEGLTCPICMDLIIGCRIASCGHAFCHQCISECLIRRKECPQCRKNIRKKVLQLSLMIDNAVKMMVISKKNDGESEDYDKWQERTKKYQEWISSHKVTHQPKAGDKLDVCDTENIWCKATVELIVKTGNRKDLLYIHYEGWNRKYDEYIYIDSHRIAPLGLYTSRTDIPVYRMLNNQMGEGPLQMMYAVVLQNAQEEARISAYEREMNRQNRENQMPPDEEMEEENDQQEDAQDAENEEQPAEELPQQPIPQPSVSQADQQQQSVSVQLQNSEQAPAQQSAPSEVPIQPAPPSPPAAVSDQQNPPLADDQPQPSSLIHQDVLQQQIPSTSARIDSPVPSENNNNPFRQNQFFSEQRKALKQIQSGEKDDKKPDEKKDGKEDDKQDGPKE